MNIPYQNVEIEQIYTRVLCGKASSIAICSADAGEGVTSLAFALAQRNLLAGYSTLLVDLNLYRPAIKNLLPIDNTLLINSSSTLNTSTLLPDPQLVCSTLHPIALNGVIAPTQRENIMKLRQPGTLEQYIKEWLTLYDTVIFDTSPLSRVNAQNIPPERVAAACDGAILMVLAGKTPETAVYSAVNKLKNADATLLGCVFNDRDNPTLQNELIRQILRIPPAFSWLSRPLQNCFSKIRLLTLEI